MGKVVKLRIRGRGAETDAPTVEDALDQIRDFVDILLGVEEAVAGTPTSALEWRLIDAHRNSPLEFDLQAFPKQFATNIDQRTDLVMSETARGLAILGDRPERPPYFTNKVMRKAQRIFERATNGLSLSEADFGDELPKVQLTPSVARGATRNVELILVKQDKPYQEVGSIEGYLRGVARDGHGRRVAYIIENVTGEEVKCIVSSIAASGLEALEIRDVWRYRRVEVFGRVHFAGLGKIDHLDADGFRFLRHRSDLPQIDDIIDPDFTGGMTAEGYLGVMRDGAHS